MRDIMEEIERADDHTITRIRKSYSCRCPWEAGGAEVGE